MVKITNGTVTTEVTQGAYDTFYKEQGFVIVSDENENIQVIAKLAKLVRNLEPKQGRIRALHEFWKKKQITGDCGRTLISYRLCEGGKSYAMSGFKLRKYS